MINVSPIGRNCSQVERDEFDAYDKVRVACYVPLSLSASDWLRHALRNIRFARRWLLYWRRSSPLLTSRYKLGWLPRRSLSVYFDSVPLQFSIGGQISFDVFPQGWDKTFCLPFLQKDGFTEIHFFGDKTSKVNDRRTITYRNRA